eukprot:8130709-Pyramimonas_sp.AAC.1
MGNLQGIVASGTRAPPNCFKRLCLRGREHCATYYGLSLRGRNYGVYYKRIVASGAQALHKFFLGRGLGGATIT